MATNCDVQVQFTARNSLAKRTSRANLTINVLLILYIILALLLNGGFVPLAKRGFFCGDSTIQYPVKTDTISFGLLLVISLFIPILFIRYCDVTLGKLFLGTDDISRIEKRRKISDCQNVSPGGSSARNGDKEDRVKRRLVVNDDDDAQEEQNLCKVLDESGMEVEYAPKSSTMMGLQSSRNFTDTQLYLFGFATTALFTGIGKTTCGRLRPHFMQRCKPDIACGAVDNLHRYIYDFQCKNELRSRDITYISTSWPSGKYNSVNQLSDIFVLRFLRDSQTNVSLLFIFNAL